jgi:hypothetical protein
MTGSSFLHAPHDVRPAGSCKHRPTSNGWSAHSSRQPDGEMRVIDSSAWCGHCCAYVEIDAKWQAKFAARGKSVPPLVDVTA